MDNSKIGFIGAGNMARSLIGGLLANEMETSRLFASDQNVSQRQNLRDQFSIEVSADNQSIVDKVDVIVLAVKPQVMSSVVSELKIRDSQLVISIAAGIRLKTIQDWLKRAIPIIRVMPNTPALIQAGAAALIANTHCTETNRNLAESIMRSVGTSIWLDDESQMDAVTALSGSGPAYFFYFMEAIEQAAIALGLSEAQARLLTIETAVGAAKMAMMSTHDLAQLRQDITSPGGTTAAALSMFEQRALNQIVEEAMQSAKTRAEQLSEEFGNKSWVAASMLDAARQLKLFKPGPRKIWKINYG